MKLKTFFGKTWIALALLSGLLQVSNALYFNPREAKASGTESPSTPSAPFDFNVFAKLAKKVVPSVVNLSSTSTVEPIGNTEMEGDPFRDFFNQDGPPMAMSKKHVPQKQMALGSGFIIEDGMLITNNHVVAQADDVEIQLTESSDDSVINGKVIGRDPDLDVALIKFTPPRKLNSLTLGDSEALEVGEFVMAVGNPYGMGHSVTHGIVSAKGRTAPDVPVASYLQTDTPINPGNSGGPLLNLKGEVVGINNAIDARAQGISFAIPINFVKSILPQLKADGKVSRGFIGAAVGPLTPELAEKLNAPKNLHAAMLMDVPPNTPAFKGGLRAYDIITGAGGSSIHTPNEVILAVTSTKVGNKLPFAVMRDGKTLKIEVTVERRPNLNQISRR
jgi:serine protease Do